MPEIQTSDRLRKIGIGVGVVAILFGVAVALAAPWLFGPRYKDDVAVYTYRVLVSDVYFDPSQEVHPVYGAFLHKEIRTYYTNSSSARERKPEEYPKEKYGFLVLSHPIVVTIQNPREFRKFDDGDYYLVPRNQDSARDGQVFVSYEPDDKLDITIVRQSDEKIVFNSTKWLDDFRRRNADGP